MNGIKILDLMTTDFLEFDERKKVYSVTALLFVYLSNNNPKLKTTYAFKNFNDNLPNYIIVVNRLECLSKHLFASSIQDFQVISHVPTVTSHVPTNPMH